jgi:hypothetical protein
MAIAFVGAWTFNVHSTPVYTSVAWDGYQPVNTAFIEPPVDADDSMQLQALAITELLSTATSNDIDMLIGKNDLTVNISGDANNIHLGSLAQGSGTANVVLEDDLPPNYYYLALVPLGILGFTIFKGWRASQEERTPHLYASQRVRSRRVRI